MNIKVLKFGGTSLRSVETRKIAYQHIINYSKYHKLILVVSAIGIDQDPYATDTLISLGSNLLSSREKASLVSMGEQLSSLIICSELLELGCSTCAIPFQYAGIITDHNYDYGKVIKMDAKWIKHKLKEVDIIVVGGFIGVNTNKEVTTLGRGGSDYSAVLFAKMLGLHEVSIFSDVDGVYNQDPKLNKNAIKYDHLTYDEMLKMKSCVLHDRCVKFAKKEHIKIYLRGTFSHDKGTLVDS
ncbi:MAG: aspartate kinase [Erysipelotrichaceae bacterium]